MTGLVLDKKRNMKIRFLLRSVVVYVKWNVNSQNYIHWVVFQIFPCRLWSFISWSWISYSYVY